MAQADVAQLPVADDTFATINCLNAFHCFPDPATAACELARILQPHGSLLINVVLPPTGFGSGVAKRILRWGKGVNIVNEAIPLDDLHRIFACAGLDIVRQRLSGNQATMWLTKVDRSQSVAEPSPAGKRRRRRHRHHRHHRHSSPMTP